MPNPRAVAPDLGPNIAEVAVSTIVSSELKVTLLFTDLILAMEWFLIIVSTPVSGRGLMLKETTACPFPPLLLN